MVRENSFFSSGTPLPAIGGSLKLLINREPVQQLSVVGQYQIQHVGGPGSPVELSWLRCRM